MFGDRRATFRGFDHIEREAQRARSIGRLTGHSRFDIIVYLTGPLRFSLKPNLEFKLYNKGDFKVPAFINFESPGMIALNVEKGVWSGAAAGFSDDRYVIAHEIGHIIMHHHDKLAYSATLPSMIASLPPEDRTEPQANLFADLFLVPSDMLAGFAKSSDISEYFDVPLDCAERRLAGHIDKRRRLFKREYAGDPCTVCLNFTLVRNGTCLKCDTCGSTTGCS